MSLRPLMKGDFCCHLCAEGCFLPLHAAGYSQGSGNGRQDGDGNLQDGFPSVFLHNCSFLVVNNSSFSG